MKNEGQAYLRNQLRSYPHSITIFDISILLQSAASEKFQLEESYILDVTQLILILNTYKQLVSLGN